MSDFDPAAEWNRLSEEYREKSDDELETIAADAYDLTDVAREVLETAIRDRGLGIKPNYESPSSDEAESEVEPAEQEDAADLDLQELCRADSAEELQKIKQWFDDSGIATFISDGNVQELKDFSGSFEDGVPIKVRCVDFGRALGCMNALNPGFVQTSPDEAETAEPPRCPACHSDEIVFLSNDPKDKKLFRWRCDSCGHRWTDDGVVRG